MARKSKRLQKVKGKYIISGGVAHMVERSLRMREARGSIPRTSKYCFLNQNQDAYYNNFYICGFLAGMTTFSCFFLASVLMLYPKVLNPFEILSVHDIK